MIIQLDFRATIVQEEDLVVNRKAIAEKAFKQLSTQVIPYLAFIEITLNTSLPLDSIASNGESMVSPPLFFLDRS
jgi:hypothetical protein